MERLTIDEVIEHCERTAGNAEMMFREIHNSDNFEKIASKNYWEHKQTGEWLKELKRYKDLEEAGRLVVLPCKVGETVWVTVEACEGGEFCPYNGGFGTPRCDERLCKPFVQPLSFEPFMLGEEFYLTSEEAEAALKGGGQK